MQTSTTSAGAPYDVGYTASKGIARAYNARAKSLIYGGDERPPTALTHGKKSVPHQGQGVTLAPYATTPELHKPDVRGAPPPPLMVGGGQHHFMADEEEAASPTSPASVAPSQRGRISKPDQGAGKVTSNDSLTAEAIKAIRASNTANRELAVQRNRGHGNILAFNQS